MFSKGKSNDIRTVTGEMAIHIDATLKYVVTSYDYAIAANATFKMNIKDNKILSFSMRIVPDVEHTYVASSSTIIKNVDSSINYRNSHLVQPLIAIKKPFYLWGENILLTTKLQGVVSIEATLEAPFLFGHLNLPIEKRKPVPQFVEQFLGSTKQVEKLLTSLMDLKQIEVKTELPLTGKSYMLANVIGLKKQEVHFSAKKRSLNDVELALLDEEKNPARIKLEENEAMKKAKGEKTHREIAAELAKSSELEVLSNPSPYRR